MRRIVFIFVCMWVLAVCCGPVTAAQYLEADAVSEVALTEARGVREASTSLSRCLSCGSSSGRSGKTSVRRSASGTGLSTLTLLNWTGAIDQLFDILMGRTHLSWAQIKMCYNYPPGHPLRPEYCDDDHPPKDPVPPPSGG